MMTNPPSSTACFVIIGNEILSGRTQDVNLTYLAQSLNPIGIPIKEVRVIPDNEQVIIETIRELRGKFDYVVTSGGIGPTHDDITAAAIAKAFNVPLVRDSQAVRLLEDHYKGTEHGLNEARLKMANVPQGASLIDNPISRAPGFKIGNVYVLAGVPKIFQAMVDGLKVKLRGGPPILSRTVSCNLPEGKIAEGLAAIQQNYPDVEIGSYPYFKAGRFGASLVVRGLDIARITDVVRDISALVRDLGGVALIQDS